MSALLERDEIFRLTGCKTGAAQCRWLDQRNWIYETDSKGKPQVARAYFDSRMTGAPLPGARRNGPRMGFMLGTA